MKHGKILIQTVKRKEFDMKKFRVEDLPEIIAPVIVLLVAALLLTGCTPNQNTLGLGVDAKTTTASLGAVGPTGDLQAITQGTGFTQILQDPNGQYGNLSMPAGVIAAPVPGSDQMAYIITPNNTKIQSMKFSDGTMTIDVQGLEVNISEPLAQQVAALNIALPNLITMNKDTAAAQLDELKALYPELTNIITVIKDLLLGM